MTSVGPLAARYSRKNLKEKHRKMNVIVIVDRRHIKAITWYCFGMVNILYLTILDNIARRCSRGQVVVWITSELASEPLSLLDAAYRIRNISFSKKTHG